MSIDDKYKLILSECIFISKKGEWFLDGFQVGLDTLYSPYRKEDQKFNNNSAIMHGLTNESYSGFSGDLPRLDSEGCALEEFEIYDKYGNEISELSIVEYILILRDLKIDSLV